MISKEVGVILAAKAMLQSVGAVATVIDNDAGESTAQTNWVAIFAGTMSAIMISTWDQSLQHTLGSVSLPSGRS